MSFEDGYPNISLADWQSFKAYQKSCKTFPSHLIDEVIDRSRLNLPDHVLPLARGGAIASAAFLHKAGYRCSNGQELPQHHVAPGVLDIQPFRGASGEKMDGLWMVLRANDASLETLVYRFGSTPIFTRTCVSAKHLASYCDCTPNELPSGLGWVRLVAENHQQAVTFAQQRAKDELRGSTPGHIMACCINNKTKRALCHASSTTSKTTPRLRATNRAPCHFHTHDRVVAVRNGDW